MLPEIKKKICVSLLPLTENKKKRKKLYVSLSPLAKDKRTKWVINHNFPTIQLVV